MPYRLVAVVGPTAVGKTRLALRLAHELEGEIISADSRQIYRCMDIGTAKPTPEERIQIPHHLLDIVDPNQPFSLAQFQSLAFQSIDEVFFRSHAPLLVGGTGQYIWSVLDNWSIPRIKPDYSLRHQLEKRAREGNLQEIYSELKILNPALAMRIDPRNLRRVIRAIEVAHSHGAPPSKQPPKYDSLIIGLTAPRTEVYKRINARIQSMIAEGLVEEVRRLLAKGYNPDLPAMSGIGYRQILRHLNGEIPLPAAIESMNIDSHRLVRQQYNWFKPSDMRIHWFDTTCDVYTDIIHLVKEYLQ